MRIVRSGRWRLPAIIVAAAAVQLFLAVRFYGFMTGDDVEVLEEAFRVAIGYTYRPWNIRNLFVPDFVFAPPIFVAWKLGLRDIRTLIVIATVPSIIAAAITTIFAHRIAMRWTGDNTASELAAALFAFHWIPLGFGSTVYPRTIATMCVLGAVLLLGTRTSRHAALLAGALAAIAFAERFSEAVFLLPLLLLARRRALAVLGGFVLTAVLVVGGYDWLRWGEWFHSLRNFARLTLVESDFSSRVKHQVPLWYLLTLPRWLSPTLLPLLWVAVRRHLVGGTFLVIPLLALSLVAHKEIRYVQGLIPFAMILAALGFANMPRRVASVLVAAAFVWHLYGLNNFARKSMAAVDAAGMLGRDERVHTVAMSQLWAYGGKLYFGERMNVVEIGQPPDFTSHALGADAISLYARDATPEVEAKLRAHGFVRIATLRNAMSREVVVFRR